MWAAKELECLVRGIGRVRSASCPMRKGMVVMLYHSLSALETSDYRWDECRSRCLDDRR